MARILVIDDDDEVRTTIVRILTRAAYETFEAADGAQGMKLFHSHRPDLIITDIFMPKQEGLETIREIRTGSPDVRVLAISGGGAGMGTEYLRLSGHLGADATLTKPFRAAELLAAVDGLLARSAEHS
ncbi:MAG: response regulator [Alphaproteobacteria bacterium]|nr:response regulator [Alphaproteobacteria bacterium]MDE2495366.1 response regulator [Alphaproteobacteria bacterium]